jgi:ribA/ribD-fused uncharacterized protein
MIDDFDFCPDNRWLSNFWACVITMDGLNYPTVEHAYQAAKTRGVLQQKQIRLADSPGLAKQLGQRVKLREDWEQIKVTVMHTLVEQKFLRHGVLAEKLLATGEHFLVEGNTWNDRFWGVCGGYGRNNLGHILMQVRDRLNEGRTAWNAHSTW